MRLENVSYAALSRCRCRPLSCLVRRHVLPFFQLANARYPLGRKTSGSGPTSLFAHLLDNPSEVVFSCRTDLSKTNSPNCMDLKGGIINVGGYKRGTTWFCRVLTRRLDEMGMNPAQLQRKLVLNGFDCSEDYVYKIASGRRNPSAQFVVYAARVLSKSPQTEEAVVASFLHAHNADVSDEFRRKVEKEQENLKRSAQ